VSNRDALFHLTELGALIDEVKGVVHREFRSLHKHIYLAVLCL